MIKKTTQLKRMLVSDQTEFIMEAHSGLSAKIAEEAGFKGIWGSGLSISAAMGVRDANEASWTQVLDAVEFMSDATTVPILLDADTGYGNFNNVRRLVRKLEQRERCGRLPRGQSSSPRRTRYSRESAKLWPTSTNSRERSRRPRTRSTTRIFAWSPESNRSSPAGD